MGEYTETLNVRADAVVEFIPPSVTLDSVDVEVKDTNVIEVTTRITVWTDNVEDQPTFNYNLGNTYFSRDGMEISSEPKQRVYVDILTLRVFDLYIKRLEIEVAEESYTVNIGDYVNIVSSDAEYPDVGLWVMI
jgi:hypothetical protein